jgi:hypothetical protein
MIDYRKITRDRLLERTAALNAKLEGSMGSDTQTAIAVLSGEVKALTDLLLDFGEADCDLGHQILEAQRNRQDVLDAQEEEQKARGMEPEDLLPIINGNRIQ